MPRFRAAYPPEFRRRMVELVRSGRPDTSKNAVQAALGKGSGLLRLLGDVWRP